MAYVVKSWQAFPQPNEKGEYIRISGRQEGIISWLLSYVGIDPTVHMSVTADNFHLERRTFWGYSRRTIPIVKICEVRDGFERPWLAPLIFWILGGICFFDTFGSLFGGKVIEAFGILFIASLLFGIGYLIYIYRRFLVVGVIGSGGLVPATVAFKPSFIEGKSIDADDAEIVGRILQTLVDAKNSKS